MNEYKKYYNLLKTRPFLNNHINQYRVSESIIIDALESCYKNCAFSLFPYIIDKLNSKQSLRIYNSGNCISLSMYIQEFLLNNYSIKSYLIPATIPNKYKRKGYLDISHVALAIPKNSNEVYIADPAFYYLNPCKISLDKMNSSMVFAKSIYDAEYSRDLKDYSTIDKIITEPKLAKQDIMLNKYQTISKNTFIVESYYSNDKKDKWEYYLTNIINPDEAITSFFIPIQKDPFIMTTKLDDNGICTSSGYLKISSNGILKFSYDDKSNIIMPISQLDNLTKKNIGLFTNRFFKRNLSNYIEYFN